MDRRGGFARRLSFSLCAALIAGSIGAKAQVGVPELLPTHRAFRLVVSRPETDRLRLTWSIADGYYLYRERFSFETSRVGGLKPAELPPGKLKDDPFFGETQIYRQHLAFELELNPAAAAQDFVSLRVISQGCADIGICFPPEARGVRLGLGETVIATLEDPLGLPAVGTGAANMPAFSPDLGKQPPSTPLR